MNGGRKFEREGRHVTLRGSRKKRLCRSSTPNGLSLTQRDIGVLAALARHRLLSGEQLRRLVLGCGASRARRRLRALYDHGLVDRVSVVAEPTRNIPPFLYMLSNCGKELLEEQGITSSLPTGRDRGLRFVRHRYLVNEFFVTLTEAVGRLQGSVRLRDWRHEQELKVAGDDGRGEVERVVHPSLPEPMSFLPDAYFELEVGPGRSLAYFLEMDLSTHGHRIWRQRARLYTAYSDPMTGLFRRRFGRETFRLLIVTPRDWRGRSRCDNVLATIVETIGPSDLFLGAPITEVSASAVLGGVWRRAGKPGRVGLLDAGTNGARVRVQGSGDHRGEVKTRVRRVGPNGIDRGDNQ